MKEIKPSVSVQDVICAEITAPPTAMVVFGASGDLTRRKLLASIFKLYTNDLIDDKFYLLGCGRKKISDQQFRDIAKQALKEKNAEVPAEKLKAFTDKLHYASGDYTDPQFYANLKDKIAELNKSHGIDGNILFYLAVPPFLYPVIVQQLGDSGLSCLDESQDQSKIRLVIEKPFGRDSKSAAELNKIVHKCFDESQVYRIDHYLGKETVQNILMFRFANAIFEPIWKRDYIDHVQITIAESLGIGHRSGYYDKSGALRDMFQNHMLSMLSLVAMEPPTSFNADHIRDEKVKVLRSIRKFNLEPWSESIVRGQYIEGHIDGEKVQGYHSEEGVDTDSTTETYVAAKLFIDNWRWKDVPFYLRTGKRLSHKDTEIAITFKKVPHSMFLSADLEEMPPNILVLQIQPDEGITLSFQAKRPGSKICMSTLRMNFNYSDIFGTETPEAYQRLLLDCMVGDQTLFTRQDDVEISWKLLTPILQAWEKDKTMPFEYRAGAESFSAADNLIEADGRTWRKLATD
ncbi:MAG: glucose-6-phosphate dehydrogenase [Planctomycetes bacterium]|nr:glucose-6-phosphate dehydrogenase [Planctomycetota bacterium]